MNLYKIRSKTVSIPDGGVAACDLPRSWCKCSVGTHNTHRTAHFSRSHPNTNVNISARTRASKRNQNAVIMQLEYSTAVLCGRFKQSIYHHLCGPGSLCGIATDYGLEGPGSNPGEDEIFRRSRPALGPTQPPVKCVLGVSRG